MYYEHNQNYKMNLISSSNKTENSHKTSMRAN